MKLLAPTTDRIPEVKKGVSAVLRTVDRELVVDHFRSNASVWEFRVQLCSDLGTMPIEDPTQRWDEAKARLSRSRG